MELHSLNEDYLCHWRFTRSQCLEMILESFDWHVNLFLEWNKMLTAVHLLASSRLDYCNALHVGLLQ